VKKAMVVAAIAFFCGGVTKKKNATAIAVIAFFCGDVIEKKKKTTTTFVTFFNAFVAKKNNSSCYHLFLWFCYKEGDSSNVITFFYGGDVVKKAKVVGCCRFLSFFLFLFLWSS
jgi:hypothetical protein